MYFIFSPTKEMREVVSQKEKTIPRYIEKSKLISSHLCSLSKEEIMSRMKVNEKIAQINVDRYKALRFDANGTSAIEAYCGLQYKQLKGEYNLEEETYMQKHIRILSGLYGVLTPFDSIYPYRLEMQYKGYPLYVFWEKELQEYFQGNTIINVASQEYSKVLETHEAIIHIQFKVKKNEKYMVSSTPAKIARGKFLQFIITNRIATLEGVRQFSEDGYRFSEEESNTNTIVFLKEDV